MEDGERLDEVVEMGHVGWMVEIRERVEMWGICEIGGRGEVGDRVRWGED